MPFEGAFVKLLPANRRAIEAVCAWLAREMAAGAPEPFFVTVARSRIPTGCAWQYDGAEHVCFGTREIPSARSIRRIDSQHISERLNNWPCLIEAAILDTLIANEDRSEDNVLLDGSGKLWIVDHDRALGGSGERVFSEPYVVTQNFLLDQIKNWPALERFAIRQRVHTACVTAIAAVNQIPYGALLIQDELAEEIQRFLLSRSAALTSQVLSVLGISELTFDPKGGDDRPPRLH
jgi:hypothetical protein